MKKIVFILLIFLIGCAPSIELSQECARYADYNQISKLAGIKIKHPVAVKETENDCIAQYTVKDTTFTLYYWKYSSDNKAYSKYNHTLIHISNCKGSLCDSFYEFHYIGPPRELEVTCKNGKIWMNDAGKITEKEINCDVLKNIGKNNQKTWKCEYNQIMEENCNENTN
ncbi:hypothetical protein GF358_01890 [Candidatus Woesearchaeota archaeon]|nr:hypothetical protein [Candidatus Woesearchaeota archaeon]